MPFYVKGSPSEEPDDDLFDSLKLRDEEEKEEIKEKLPEEPINRTIEKTEVRQETEPEEKPEKKKGSAVLDYVLTVVIAAAIGLCLNFFVIVNAVIPTGSMENTIMSGDRIFGFRLAYKFEEPARYDIVIFRYPDDESQLFIKRMIGLPGETVVISDGKVYVYGTDVNTSGVSDEELLDDPMMLGNATVLDDSFCPETPLGGDDRDGVFRVPEGHYFMLGDNRNHSKDSRFWDNKYVAYEKILGKAFVKYWPVTEMKTL